MTSGLEIAANAVTTVAILLAGRNNIHTWWIGIVGCVLFAIVFERSQLYADALLQIFFIVTGIIGWWQWLHGDRGQARPVTQAGVRVVALTLPAGIVAALAYGALLHAFTDAYAPFADSTVLVFSIIGQLLLMQRRVESWAFWLLVDSIAVPLFASRGLYLTAVLYAAYWIIALIALRHWHRLAREHVARVATSGATA
jgi:nicotinamide mononucleotide transporter